MDKHFFFALQSGVHHVFTPVGLIQSHYFTTRLKFESLRMRKLWFMNLDGAVKFWLNRPHLAQDVENVN